MDPADDLIFDAFDALVARLTRMDPSGAAIRERQHLDPFFKDELERLVGTRPVAKKLHTPHFPGLGAVDVVVSEPLSTSRRELPKVRGQRQRAPTSSGPDG